jgi:ribosome biogenesis GTPase
LKYKDNLVPKSNKLTNKQKKAILHKQNSKQNTDSNSNLRKCKVVSRFKYNVLIRDKDKSILCKTRKNLPEIVVGDWVFCSKKDNEYVIESRENRKNEFASFFIRKVRAFAANLDRLLIVVAVAPKIDTFLIESSMLNCYLSEVEPILICNKQDLLENKNNIEVQEFLEKISYYEKIGLKILKTSAKLKSVDIEKILEDKTSLLFGQSGVGKSSILNILMNENIATNIISPHTTKGQHTTSVAREYSNKIFSIIDCPGIRGLSLPEFDKKYITLVYPDIADVAKKCKFKNCSHRQKEQFCALHNCSEIPSWRLKNFFTLQDLCDEKKLHI